MSLCTGVIVYMCLCMLEVSLFYCWCQRTVGRRSAGGFFFNHLVWGPCVLVSLCTCAFVCLRSLCFNVGVNKRSDGRSSGGFFCNHLVRCPCVLVSLCTCVFACLRSLCFTDGVNGRSDGDRRADHLVWFIRLHSPCRSSFQYELPTQPKPVWVV